MEVEFVAKLSISKKDLSIYLDKKIPQDGIAKPGIIIRKDGKFYLTSVGYIHDDAPLISLITLEPNDISPFNRDLGHAPIYIAHSDSKQCNDRMFPVEWYTDVMIKPYYASAYQKHEIKDVLLNKLGYKLKQTVKRIMQGLYNGNSLFNTSRYGDNVYMVPKPVGELRLVFNEMTMNRRYDVDLYLCEGFKWRIYWDHQIYQQRPKESKRYYSFGSPLPQIIPHVTKKKVLSTSIPITKTTSFGIDTMRNRAISTLAD